MSWTTWILLSAVALACYDLAKKASVRGNAVMPVLFCSSVCGAIAFVAGLAVSGRLEPAVAVNGRTLMFAAAKALIVAASWVFTFTALKTLPITIATPIRASSPALVFIAAFFIYGEMPSVVQGLGMLLVFGGYWAFSWAGRAEGIDFLRNRAVWYAIAGACLSAVSSIWDKHVFQFGGVETVGVQLYYQIGLVIVYAIANAIEYLCACRHSPFYWRWTIPFTGILLAGADFLYFNGIDTTGTPISVASLLRRFSVVITFLVGAWLFHETNLRRKALALVAVLVGIGLLCW